MSTPTATDPIAARRSRRAELIRHLHQIGFTGDSGCWERPRPEAGGTGRDRVVVSRQRHDPIDTPDHVAVFGPDGHRVSLDLASDNDIDTVLSLIDQR